MSRADGGGRNALVVPNSEMADAAEASESMVSIGPPLEKAAM